MTQRYRLLLNERVAMRDGVELSTDVWLPAAAGAPIPALLIRNIYNNADRRYLAWMEPFVAAGYAVVAQDCRGRHDSDGTWDPYMCEVTDGFDTVEWVGTQAWCDGQVGPWSHQISPWGRASLGPNGEFEDAVFGADAVGDNIGEHLRWYDARLRGTPTDIDDEPPVRIFVMGRNEWRSEHEWPIARTRWTDAFLAPDGHLGFTPPDAAAPTRHFTYDPADPVPSWGAQYQSADLGGPRDRRAVEARPDVLTWTTDVLAHDLEVTGPIVLALWAATDAPDTDWTAALVDVFPDGRVIILCEGICRARYRDEMAAPEFVPANAPTEFRVDLWSTSNAFLAGHRIRLEVSSSNFPRFDRNMNTGGRVGFETEWRVARQTVFHDATRPSRLILPVIPERGAAF